MPVTKVVMLRDLPATNIAPCRPEDKCQPAQIPSIGTSKDAFYTKPARSTLTEVPMTIQEFVDRPRWDNKKPADELRSYVHGRIERDFLPYSRAVAVARYLPGFPSLIAQLNMEGDQQVKDKSMHRLRQFPGAYTLETRLRLEHLLDLVQIRAKLRVLSNGTFPQVEFAKRVLEIKQLIDAEHVTASKKTN